jgi:hypothetical protein|tara:strand:- start:3954 stop:4163 length:210 start_codon:yes stop_codon:yes gene_type:complete
MAIIQEKINRAQRGGLAIADMQQLQPGVDSGFDEQDKKETIAELNSRLTEWEYMDSRVKQMIKDMAKNL